jgi:ABC-2 type transport system ATP-binding protein
VAINRRVVASAAKIWHNWDTTEIFTSRVLSDPKNGGTVRGRLLILLQITDLGKRYGKKNDFVQALSNVNFNVDEGEIVCVLGHNGAGKTTLIKIIAGLLLPDSGMVCLDGVNMAKKPDTARKRIGIVLEGNRNIYNYLTARDNIRYFGMLNGINKKDISELLDKYLAVFDLSDFADQPANNLSRGMQQKVAIMVALVKNPDILLLDEPTLGLDIVSAETVTDILHKLARETGKTIPGFSCSLSAVLS